MNPTAESEQTERINNSTVKEMAAVTISAGNSQQDEFSKGDGKISQTCRFRESRRVVKPALINWLKAI